MKRAFLSKSLLFIISVCMCLFFTSCSTENNEEVKPVGIEILTQHEGSYYIGDDIDLSEITFNVKYSDKSKKKFELNDTMISPDDKEKFFKAGEYTITINYEGISGHFQINVVDVAKEGKYLAKFYTLGGSSVVSMATDTVRAFPETEREGYAFDGWYTDIRYVRVAGEDTVEYMGDRVKEPYELTKNTNFYAKWIDNRICTVTFLDSDNSVLNFKKENESDADTPMVISIHYGERINIDDYVYPIDETPGKTFIGWNVLNGNTDRVTTNINVKANFRIDKCTIRIEYENNSGNIISVENIYDYGEEIYVGNYRKPTKEGYESTWVVYKNYSEEYEKLPDNQTIILTEEYTKVCANFKIITYKINIYNGKEKQTEENLKSGEIELADPYNDFYAEWDGNFDFADYTQEPNISEPTVLYDALGNTGYNGQWCLVVPNESGNMVWYNMSGHIWNQEKCIFEPQVWENDEGENNWTLRNADGEYIAKVENKILSHIKGEVTVRAKYIKKVYDVTVFRYVGELQIKLATFKVRYMADFDLYDPYYYNPGTDVSIAEYSFSSDYNGGELIEKAKKEIYNPTLRRDRTDENPEPDRKAIEQFYLLENTNHLVKKYSEAYYLTNEITSKNADEDDWEIKWYSDAKRTDLIDFAHKIKVEEDKPPVPTTVEVRGNTNIYCSDIDNRKYEVSFVYGFGFENNDGSGNVGFGYSNYRRSFLKENEVVVPPTISNITYVVPSSSVQLTYEFEGWFLTPYDVYLKTGSRGEQQTNFIIRKSSVVYYAHYKCSQAVTIKIYDVTQSAAFMTSTNVDEKGRKYSGAEDGDVSYSYTVADDTISYKLDKGDLFDVDSMIYKGIRLADNSIISGQNYYNDQKRYEFYTNHYCSDVGIKSYLINNGLNKENLVKHRAVLNAILDDFNNALKTAYEHDYTHYTESEYEFYFLHFSKANLEEDDNYYEVKLTESIFNNFSNIYKAVKSKTELKNYEIDSIIEIVSKVDSYKNFVSYYLSLMEDLYNNNFNRIQTGFKGLTRFSDNMLSERLSASYMSWKDIFEIAIFVMDEYINFFDAESEYIAKYSAPVQMPMYKTSYYDLNNAYGYNVNNNEEKYSFSGWFEDSNYTRPIQYEFSDFKFIANSDITIYAKWTDVTKGTEGLVYEEVIANDGTNTFPAYVLVDFANNDEFTSKYPQTGDKAEYYYITRNDMGKAPSLIASTASPIDISLQIPASIDKYIDKTEQARNEKENWINNYKKYLVYTKSLYTYTPALAQFNDNETYYVKETYPVIGIKSDATVNYAKYIVSVEIPLNIYFIEEGAFRNCPIELFIRKKAKGTEIAENYVVVDEDAQKTESVVIYQKESSPYVSVVGRGSGESVTPPSARTIIAYAVNYHAVEGSAYTGISTISEDNKTYSVFDLPSGITNIAAYAFNYSRNLMKIRGTENVTRIGKYAFIGSPELTTYGAEDGKITIDTSLLRIEKEAFRSCTKITDIDVRSGSNLTFVGDKTFFETSWYMRESAKGIIVLGFTDAESLDTGILVDFTSIANFQGYDKEIDGTAVKYNENGIKVDSGIYNGVKSEYGSVLYLASGANRSATVILNFRVKIISEKAFYEDDIERITIDSVKYVEDESFGKAAKLSIIEIRQVSDYGATELGIDVFSGRNESSKITFKFENDAVKEGVIAHDSWDDYAQIIRYE